MKAALIATGAGLVLLAGLLTVTQLGYAWENPCSRSGPVPARVVLNDAGGSVLETRSWWPIGSVCDWERIDGAGTVRSQVGDDVLTAATYGIALAGILSMVGASWRRPRSADENPPTDTWDQR